MSEVDKELLATLYEFERQAELVRLEKARWETRRDIQALPEIEHPLGLE
jgi:hypothetical protein